MVVVTRGRPAGPLSAGVVRLTVIDITRQNGPPRGTPGFIGDDLLRRAIRVGDLKLGEQRQPIAVDVALPTVEAESPSIPTIAQDGANGVAPFAQEVCHDERLVAQAVVVTRPSWSHDVIAHGDAVDLYLVDAQRRHVEPCFLHTPTDAELAAQKRRWLRPSGVLLPVGRHETCSPVVGMKQPCLDGKGHAPR